MVPTLSHSGPSVPLSVSTQKYRSLTVLSLVFKKNVLLLRLGKGTAYCVQFVCVSVCVSICSQAYLWNHLINLHKICSADPLWLWLGRPLVALRTSGFMDDVTFGRSRPYGDAWLSALRYRDGVWCLWMPCFINVNKCRSITTCEAPR